MLLQSERKLSLISGYLFFFNNSISSSICKLPISSEICNCTFKNTNKVSIDSYDTMNWRFSRGNHWEALVHPDRPPPLHLSNQHFRESLLCHELVASSVLTNWHFERVAKISVWLTCFNQFSTKKKRLVYLLKDVDHIVHFQELYDVSLGASHWEPERSRRNEIPEKQNTGRQERYETTIEEGVALWKPICSVLIKNQNEIIWTSFWFSHFEKCNNKKVLSLIYPSIR